LGHIGFSFKTYQNELNLHLYTPAASAHPSGTPKGTIFGNLQRYWSQNRKLKDYARMAHSFGRHLQNRGHNTAMILLLFKEAALHIEQKESIQSIVEREAAA
jgi:hypothetical protein